MYRVLLCDFIRKSPVELALRSSGRLISSNMPELFRFLWLNSFPMWTFALYAPKMLRWNRMRSFEGGSVPFYIKYVRKAFNFNLYFVEP